MGMIKFRAPALPLPSREYDPSTFAQFVRALRLYFTQLDSTTAIEHELFQGGDFVGGLFTGQGRGLVQPYGSFFSLVTQTAASTTIAYPITYTNTDLSNGVTLSNASRLNVTYPGIYNIQFSVQLANDNTAPIDIDIWLRKNGVDVANSNSMFGLAQRKGVGDPFHVLGAVNLFVQLAANDYVELVWSTTSTSAYLKYNNTQTNPTVPVTPSIITTISFVSAIP